MARAVALLRAVNVGGRTATKAQLTGALEGAGLTGVSTFLASGNVLFDLPPPPPPALRVGISPASSPASGSDPDPQPGGQVTGSFSGEQRAALERNIEGGLLSVLGFAVEAFVRTSVELGALAAFDPFPTVDPSVARQVAFLKTRPVEQARAAVAALSTDRDTLVLADREVWWLARDGVGRSALKPGSLDRALGQPVTARSLTTVTRLAALLRT